MGNLDLIHPIYPKLNQTMNNIFSQTQNLPTITINNKAAYSRSNTNTKNTPSKTQNRRSKKPLLSRIADQFKAIKKQREEDFQSEIQNSLPLSNAKLIPDPSLIPMDFTRHILELIKENERLISIGQKPVNLVEEKIRLLRPSKRKFFMVQL